MSVFRELRVNHLIAASREALARDAAFEQEGVEKQDTTKPAENRDSSLCGLCEHPGGARQSLSKRDLNLVIRPWTHTIRLLKAELDTDGNPIDAEAAEERFVLGVVLEPETVDAQSDIYSEDEIRKAAHYFMERTGHMGLMHKQLVDGRIKILETYLAPTTFTVGDQVVKKGTWLIGARVVDDTLWQKVKNGEFNGWSIGGTAVKEPDAAYNSLVSLFAA